MITRCILAVDQSTSASKVFLLDARGQIAGRFSKSHRQHYPAPGHVEHDAQEIWQNVREGIRALSQGGEEIAGLAISNQRETTVLWDRQTGEPLCPAVVWQDVRGQYICHELAAYADSIRKRTGLTLSAYFPAAKAAAKLREDPKLRQMAQEGKLCIGTMDSYLIYRLTGGSVFKTDLSNASRTQLMDLKTLGWSGELCKLFDIPMQCLAEIVPCDAAFGETSAEGIPPHLPITGVMGDSHAAFFGQGCHHKGMAKATYGTGSSVMMHIGDTPLLSSQGLSTSVGYAFRGETCYVLEGNVTSSGDTLRWLCDEAGMIEDIAEAEKIASELEDTQGVYLVPAFSGLGAPYNQAQARAIICGLNRGSAKKHIVRAALESIAYQDADIIRAMEADTQSFLQELRADGGPSANSLLMQFQADVLGCPVQCASASELSALGSGYMAGLTLGLYTGTLLSDHASGKCYLPQKSLKWREEALAGWKDAVARSAN